MSGFLLDTNVILELRKRERCAPRVDAWIRTIPREQIFISVLVIRELRRGVILKRRNDPESAAVLERWFASLTDLYAERILPVTIQIAEEWGKLSAVRPIPPEDGLMAATASVHGLTLVTRNVRNVDGLGVKMLNPWN